nr:hypothetical protein [Providencia rustigianii]
MKNNLEDLHNYLFMQLERLSDEDLKGEELKEEIGRAKALSAVASQIVNNGQLAISVKRMASEGRIKDAPNYLEVKKWADFLITKKCVIGCVKTTYYRSLNSPLTLIAGSVPLDQKTWSMGYVKAWNWKLVGLECLLKEIYPPIKVLKV